MAKEAWIFSGTTLCNIFLYTLIYSLGSVSSSTHITLQCDPHEEGKLESLQDPLTVPVVDHLRVVSSGKFIEKNYITVM